MKTLTALNTIQREFPLTEKMVYMDVAYHNILPKSAVTAMETFIRAELQNGGFPPSWQPAVEATREKFAALIGADPAEIAFVKNTAEGINAIAAALPLRSGDNVLTNDLEHASNFLPWCNLVARGIDVRVVPSNDGRVPLMDIVAKVDHRTRAVAISAVQYRNGFRGDLAGLSEVCRGRGVCLVVDAIQALGTLEFNVNDLGVDVVACGGHKGLLGPYGVGGLYVRRELIPQLGPAYLAGEGVHRGAEDQSWSLYDDARRFEVGNHNYLGLVGLNAALDILLELDVRAIERHVLGLGAHLVEGLRQRGVTIMSPLGEGERSGIVTFAVPEPGRAVEYLEANAVRVSLRGGHVRASFHIYNTTNEIDHALSLLDDHLREFGRRGDSSAFGR